MFGSFTWLSESRGCDKVVDGVAEHKMAHAIPVVEMRSDSLPKRKREDDGPTVLAHGDTLDAKRRKVNTVLDDRTAVPDLESVQAGVDGRQKTAATIDPSRIYDVIESQFSLEILLKHKELRLINQELAKCQVALEQLRRCHLIPYPVSQGTSTSMLNISSGKGSVLGQKEKVPQWAAPFGVTDGPYSRHYAKWLIPDPSFDGVEVEWQRSLDQSRAGKTVPEGRATRHSIAEGTPASKSRSQRGSTSQKFQALPSGYAQPKEKAGPCILKRGDGQWVKLVCPECHRDNFSSTQGFINHCRIAHKIEFKSHEEAAVASGQAIELDEVGGIVGEEKSPTTNNLVHPLIRSAPPEKEAFAALLSHIETSRKLFLEGRLPGVTSIPTSATSSPVKVARTPAMPSHNFVPSSFTPHLSELMRSKGFGGNLDEAVGEAKQKVDLDELSSQDEDSEAEPETTRRAIGGLDGADSPLPPMRMPARAGVLPAPLGRPSSSKGIDVRNPRQPALSGISPRLCHAIPVINTNSSTNCSEPSGLAHSHPEHSPESRVVDVDVDMLDGPSLLDLSPNTVASNNAPSLVSDDGEYDEGDDAESAASEDEDDDSVAEIQFEDDGDKVVPRTIMRNRSGSGSDAMRLKKEDKHKHVTFVSPVKDVTRERKGRKI
ncbi:uncharacterized protein PAC_10276 [Phialocephala subalpina]|uniref:AHC1-like C2H2 zinc-finger domain-containing protein n=1 Tax=Phialocephala subalpina TaxID=576137 RepID=A0A1L7X5T3_9HELO|nr:uncharacterized protein PAC_10276 [Phialocephala subalpina]